MMTMTTSKQCDGCKGAIPEARKGVLTVIVRDGAGREDTRHACSAPCLVKLFLAHLVAAKKTMDESPRSRPICEVTSTGGRDGRR